MDAIIVELHVDPKGRITGRAPSTVPSGDYTAALRTSQDDLASPLGHARLDWPAHDPGPWPDDLSLRREDLYGDDGR